MMNKIKHINTLGFAFKIMRDLDYKCGVPVTDLIDIEEEQSCGNTLAKCMVIKFTSEDFINRLLNMDNMNDKVRQDIINKVIENNVTEISNPVKIIFATKCLFLPREDFKEIVIHEYAHALVSLKCMFDIRQEEADAHGDEFQYTVKQLGGKKIYATIDEDGSDKKMYDRAKELEKQYYEPYTVHYIRRIKKMDGTTKYFSTGEVRRKYNCKYIKEAIKNAKFFEYENEYETLKLYNTYIIGNEQFIIFDANNKI